MEARALFSDYSDKQAASGAALSDFVGDNPLTWPVLSTQEREECAALIQVHLADVEILRVLLDGPLP